MKSAILQLIVTLLFVISLAIATPVSPMYREPELQEIAVGVHCKYIPSLPVCQSKSTHQTIIRRDPSDVAPYCAQHPESPFCKTLAFCHTRSGECFNPRRQFCRWLSIDDETCLLLQFCIMNPDSCS
ncbi:hypothetical protein BDQ17DRAFT_536604 [Cyathus striatus]|nr:hypothetical protein BDQ17DRAFT_536604 [Cyathus striatus]